MKKKTLLLIIFSVVLIGAIAWCANTPYREVNLNENIQRIKNLNTCFSVHELYKEKYCCPIKPLHAALLSLNAAEILMISSNFQFQAPLE